MDQEACSFSTSLVIGPTRASMWHRKTDDKLILLIGEHHKIILDSEEHCNNALSFQDWFLSVIVNDIAITGQTWDIFLERDTLRGYIPPTTFLQSHKLLSEWATPLQTMKYLHPWLIRSDLVRFHKIDIRPREGQKVAMHIASDTESEYYEQPQKWPGILDDYVKTMETTLPPVKVLIEKQIAKITPVNSHQMEQLTNKMFLEIKTWKTKVATFQSLLTSEMDWTDLVDLSREYLLLMMQISDFYTISRMLKPYVQRVLVMSGMLHTQNMDNLLSVFDFELLFPLLQERKYHVPFSCHPLPTSIPMFDKDVKGLPLKERKCKKPRLDVAEKQEHLISRLRSLAHRLGPVVEKLQLQNDEKTIMTWMEKQPTLQQTLLWRKALDVLSPDTRTLLLRYLKTPLSADDLKLIRLVPTVLQQAIRKIPAVLGLPGISPLPFMERRRYLQALFKPPVDREFTRALLQLTVSDDSKMKNATKRFLKWMEAEEMANQYVWALLTEISHQPVQKWKSLLERVQEGTDPDFFSDIIDFGVAPTEKMSALLNFAQELEAPQDE